MAITITYDFPRPERLSHDSRLAIITGTISDSSYATNGTDLSGLTGKFKSCLRVFTDSKGGFLTEWDKTNSKLKIYRKVDASAGTRIEVANATDLSSTPGAFPFIAIGFLRGG